MPLAPEQLDRLDVVLAAEYRTLSRELGLLAIAATATAIAIHRLDGRTSVILGVPVHHRSSRGAAKLVGPLMELYPLTVSIEDDDTHHTLFTRVLRSIMTLLRRAQPGESPDTTFEVVLNVLTARYGDFAGMATVTEWMRSGHVDPGHVLRSQVFDYSGTAAHGVAGLQWELDLNVSIGDDEAAERFPTHFAAVVSAVLYEPDDRVGRQPIVDDVERAELALLDPDPTPRQHDETVHERIRRRLRSDPEWIVAEHRGSTLSAAELDHRADQLAYWLLGAGLAPGRAVGLRMPRGLDVLIAIQGVLRAGGVFVLLAPDDPPARHEGIAADADLLLILDRLPEGAAASDDPEPTPEGPRTETLPRVELDDPAYLLYTSGSTGAPKGVPISQRGLADYLHFAVTAYTDPDEDPPVVALHSALVFDLTITSLFLSFLTGGRVVVFDEEPIGALGRIALDDRITFLKATPSQLELFTRLTRSLRPLRTVVVGGEAFRRPLAERLEDSCRPGVRVFNEYGPTEAVVGCMIHEWDREIDLAADVPIGHAAPGSRVAVLDRFGHLTPTGAWGELYVRRPGMAQAYLHRNDESAERFVDLDDRLLIGRAADDESVGTDPTTTWYRTGDRVRVVRPGVATYGGRTDDQLKVNGIRLEPAEVEAAMVAHPAIRSALARVWHPADTSAVAAEHPRCRRCGLGVDVPGTELDDHGICNVCHSFDLVAPQTERWFRTEADLEERRRDALLRRRGDIDCLHLLSGGKDSTYALYQLVERGWNVHALTLDTGFLSEGAKDNVRRSVADLGISHEFATTDVMNDIFRDSLDRYSNVCQGCYKTIYTIAVARAQAMGIPVIVTGLSRGQFFETRLVPHQFEHGRFDPDEIDRTVLEARRIYHHTPDAVTELLPEQRVFDDDTIFDEIEFLDFYRYVDVELTELYEFLEERAPWVRPADTGRSTNCLINVAGIQVHRQERGYHNYAEPYSWDVRLGHKTRDEALEELDDEIDELEVTGLLADVGYEPKTNGVLTAWYQSVDGTDLEAEELRTHLRALLPEHAVPAAFVRIDEVPLA
ncbi:MAG: AMP-binding protein, partial [Acidimicrobiales bacterium]